MMSSIATLPHMGGAMANNDWISKDDVADPTPLPRCPGWFLVVRPVPVRAETKGGILLPDIVKHDYSYLNTVGKVLVVGDLAFKMPEFAGEAWASVGDYVLYTKHAGQKFVYKGVKLLLLKDTDIALVVEKPEWLDNNV